jgi:raffinose/stachyose/melibiose transport system substrate-binding protein
MRATRLFRSTLLVGALLASSAAAAVAAGTSHARTATTTLTVWDAETGNGGSLTALNAQFAKKYHVKVNRVQFGFGDLATKLRLALSGPNAPDAVQLAGFGGQGSTWVKANLLTNLDPYAKQYGWTQRFSPGFLAFGRFTSAGVHGGGSLYAIGQKAEFVGVYYSKSRLAQLGLSVPATLSAFEKDLAKAKSAGDAAPLFLADLEGWPAEHDYQAILNVAAGNRYQNIVNFAFGRANTPSIQGWLSESATILQRWASDGYLGASPSSVSYNDAVGDFAAGGSLFFMTGTWLGAPLAAKMGNDLGVFLLPPLGKGGPVVATGSESTPWGIPASSKNKTLAAEYLNFITGTHAANLMAANGDLPGAATSVKPKAGSLEASEIAIITTLQKKNGLVSYFAGATPTMASIVDPGLQELMANKTSPSAFASALQSNFNSTAGH